MTDAERRWGSTIEPLSEAERARFAAYGETLTKLAPQMDSVLRQIEWSGRDGGGRPCCPECMRRKAYLTHGYACRIGEIIATLDAAWAVKP